MGPNWNSRWAYFQSSEGHKAPTGSELSSSLMSHGYLLDKGIRGQTDDSTCGTVAYRGSCFSSPLFCRSITLRTASWFGNISLDSVARLVPTSYGGPSCSRYFIRIMGVLGAWRELGSFRKWCKERYSSRNDRSLRLCRHDLFRNFCHSMSVLSVSGDLRHELLSCIRSLLVPAIHANIGAFEFLCQCKSRGLTRSSEVSAIKKPHFSTVIRDG